GRRITKRAPLPVGSILRVGSHTLRCERGSRYDVEMAHEQQRDLGRAVSYVRSLLPAPIKEGIALADWMFLPSVRGGGDAFGYEEIDDRTFSLYLLDVAGHGIGAAMHSVSVLNVLRQHALPNVNLRDPVQVLTSLNAMFQMEHHDDQYFTMWYGIYDA